MPTVARNPRCNAAPIHEPPRVRITPSSPAPAAISYDSEDYAMLNRPIETSRHAWRVERYLRPAARDRLLEVGCGRGWLTQRMQDFCPGTYGVDVNPKAIAHGVTHH